MGCLAHPYHRRNVDVDLSWRDLKNFQRFCNFVKVLRIQLLQLYTLATIVSDKRFSCCAHEIWVAPILLAFAIACVLKFPVTGGAPTMRYPDGPSIVPIYEHDETELGSMTVILFSAAQAV